MGNEDNLHNISDKLRRDLGIAQDLVISLNLPQGVCGDCSQCQVQCSVGFNVSGKIKDVIRIREVPSEFIA